MMMMDSDTLRLLSPVSAEARDGKVQRLNTIPLVLVQKIIAVALVTGVYLLPHLCDRLKCNYPESSIVVFLHVAAYVLHSLVHVVVEYLHAKHRQLGYLGFAEETKLLRRLPVVMYAFGTLGLLITQTVLIDENNTGLSPVGFLRRRVSLFGVKLARVELYSILITIQVLLILPLLLAYIVKVVRFHSRIPPPDVYLEEELLTSYMRHQPNAEVGVSVRSQTEALLSKQADKIEYLEDHNKRMGQKLVDLTQRMALLQRNPVRS